MSLLSKITGPWLARILGVGLAGALIFSGVQTVRLAVSGHRLTDAKEVISGLTSWQAEMVTTVQLAAESPQITEKTAKAQVQQLGMDRIKFRNSINTQNRAVAQLQEATTAAHVRAEQAAAERHDLIIIAQDAKTDLKVLSETSVPADQVEGKIREMQDTLYEAGL